MFTERENRMVKAIISGKTERIRIYLSIACVISVFAVIAFVSVTKSKIYSVAQKGYENAQLTLSKVQVSTKTEETLKSGLISQQLIILKSAKVIASKIFDAFVTGYIFWTFLIVGSSWSHRSEEKIIKKLIEKR